MLDAKALGVRSSDGAASLGKGEKSSNGSHDTQGDTQHTTRHDTHRRPSNILKERVSAETFGRQRSICHHHQI